jgi:hypothetical protein
MKRKFEKFNSIMISASHTYNYMNNDHLVDWLKIYKKESYCGDEFTDYICSKGNEFESKLIEYININKIKTEFISKYITDESCNQTIELMKQGIPILYSAPVKNELNNTQGIIDILIRSDYISQLVDYIPIDYEFTLKAPNLNGDYHYVVIDIKFSSIKLRADGKYLLNSGKQPSYKVQVKIYTDAIGNIQGYNCRYGFIIGRKYIYTRENRIVNNSLYTLGIIDYSGIDKSYNYSTQKAIEWIRLVKTEGHLWSISPPSRSELYPNMSVDSGPWMREKRRISDEIKEITLIWNCGIRNRNFAIQKQICSWDNINCNSSNLNIYNNYTPIINSILSINQQTEINILPFQIKNNLFEWKIRENEIFLDFETISDIFSDLSDLPFQNTTELIFMIGVGFINNDGEFEYKKFICNQLTLDDEKQIMNDFSHFLEIRNYPKIYYWSAEPSIWKRAEARNNKNSLHLKWCDLYKIFHSEPIVIRGCFDFSLKSIAKSMKSHNMISCNLENNMCNSGMIAMLNCWKYYNTKEKNETIIEDIIAYNQFDCKVLYEILEHMRNNMI